MSEHAHYTRHQAADPMIPLGYVDDVPFDHDPLDPHPEEPTPIELVVRLTRRQREQRVERLVEIAHQRFEEGLRIHAAGRDVAGICSLVSGGNDSYTVAHLFRDRLTHIAHANTQTGIEATREHVRATAAEWGLPLIEKTPPDGQGYFDLVLGRVMAVSRKTGELVRAWPGGFPGPAAHAIMQQRLKGRCLEQIPHDLGVSGARDKCVVYIAGRRRSESKRRASVPHHERIGTVVWESPIAIWHKADLRAYRLMTGDGFGFDTRAEQYKTPVPINPVALRLGMSGECGCLANAVPGEVERWRTEFPDEPFIKRVIETEQILAGPGYEHIPAHRKTWGWGAYYDEPDAVIPMGTDSLCGPNCGPDPISDGMDPLFDLDATILDHLHAQEGNA